MGQTHNRAKGILDAKVLNEHPTVKSAHAAWTDVILKHQTPFYGQISNTYSKCTPNSIMSKGTDFFQVWAPWAPAAKIAYDKAITDVGFAHGLP